MAPHADVNPDFWPEERSHCRKKPVLRDPGGYKQGLSGCPADTHHRRLATGFRGAAGNLEQPSGDRDHT